LLDHPISKVQPRGQAIPRTDVLGVGVSAIDLPMAVAEIGRWKEAGERHYVCVADVHSVVMAQSDPELRRIHNLSGMTTPDGMPLVWASHFAGARHVERVYGPDLMLAVCRAGAVLGWRMFFFGGQPGVADELARRMADRFPGLEVAGTWTPPFAAPGAGDHDQALEAINAARSDVVWVGLGAPKQEYWMEANRHRLQATALVGVGAAFDFLSGSVPQAPLWMRQRGLEWAFRLAKEPRRLWRRYLDCIPRFLWGILRNPPRPFDGDGAGPAWDVDAL
jgi:N-acetylglucosaminyldiphosphoundecaprenol N-acetyl-beta-D-mannosaminyltransferase